MPGAHSRCCADEITCLPVDVHDVALDVLRHRIGLTYQALAEEVSADDVVEAIITRIPVPRIDLAHEQESA
jgi:MoxR-like ATPase